MKRLLFLFAGVLLFAQQDNLVNDMCQGIGYSVDDCPMQFIQTVIKKGVFKIEKDKDGEPISFATADAYNNKDKIYPIYLKFTTRLKDDGGLFKDDNGRIVYIENLPKKVRFYPKGEYIGFVRGEGEYKIQFPFTDEIYEMIPKGQVITIKRDHIHWK